MKKIVLLPLILAFITTNAQDSSFGMTLQANWNPDTLVEHSSGQKYNDIWGYTDCSANEYAILGSVSGVYFMNVTNPQSPEVIDYFEGGEVTPWRDIKTYKDRAYAVSDATAEGMMIFDLSQLPTTVTKTYHSDTLFQEAHNLFVDEDNGRLYVVGSGQEDILIYDLRANPDLPQLLNNPVLPGGYVHDIYVRDHIAYCSHLGNGLYVYDFSDPQNPVTLGTMPTYPGKILNHSSWLTEDGQRLVFCDEKRNTNVKIIDVSDPTDMEVLPHNEFRSELLAPEAVNSIAHNPYIRDQYAIVSYYHDGLQIFDTSNPDTTIRVAYYDTEPENTTYSGWFGVWGAYPFLPSGNIIVSDLHNGLFILSLDSIEFEAIDYSYMPDVTVEMNGAIVPCDGDSIILSVSSSSEQYTWYRNDTTLIGQNIASITVAEDGIYHVEVSNGHCEAVSEQVELIFNTTPDLSSMQSGTITPCENESIFFEAPNGLESYTWLKDGNALPNTGSFIQIVSSGSYRLMANNGGCASISAPFVVEFIELPSNLIQAEPAQICEGSSTTLSVETGATDYIWYLDGEVYENNNEAELVTDLAGEYSVEMSIGDCNAFSEPIQIVAAEDIVPDITFINNTLNTNPGVSYQWYINGNPINDGNDQMVIPTVNGDYHVEVLNENGCYYISEPYSFFSTSTQVPFNQQIKLFPNPVEEQLFLEINSEQNSKIQLQWMNIVGERIYQEEIQVASGNLHRLDLPDLAKGIYLLQIDNGKEKITRKIFKQ